MFVAVQHTIFDPPAFWAKAGEIVPHLPGHLKLHQCFPTRDGSRAVCVWEGISVDVVRKYVEQQVGSMSSNEYFQVENSDAIAFPSGLTSPGHRVR